MSGLLNAPYIRKRSDGIDFLRGVFAMWVLISHLVPWAAVVRGRTLENFWEKGLRLLIKIFQNNGEIHPAVLGFIVLSGYCIHRNGARSGVPFSIPGYSIRRFFRIWPVYVLAVVVGVACYIGSSNENAAIASSLTATTNIAWPGILSKLTGISVFYAPLHMGSFQGNAPLVTVMVEIWLYVLYALVIVYLRNGGRQKIALGIIAAIFLIALTFVAKQPLLMNWWNNGSLFSFALYWWIGALFVRDNPIPRKFVAGIFTIWLMLTLFFVSGNVGSGVFMGFLTEFRKILLAVLFGILIFRIDHSDHGWYAAGSRVGVAGYSIYALHAPLLIFFLIHGVNYWVVMLFTLGIAYMIFRLYEKPLTELGKRLSTSLNRMENKASQVVVSKASARD